MAAPFVLGLGTIVVSFIALKNYKEEQLKSEIIDFVKNSEYTWQDGRTRGEPLMTLDEKVKLNLSDNSLGDIKIIGWRIWSNSGGKVAGINIESSFEPAADTHLVAYVFVRKDSVVGYFFSEVIWPEKIRRPIRVDTALGEKYGLEKVDIDD